MQKTMIKKLMEMAKGQKDPRKRALLMGHIMDLILMEDEY